MMQQTHQNNPTIIETNSSDFVNRTSREFGMYILLNRAIPSVTDGLKQSQRIAMWIIRNKSKEVKTMSVVGEMIASGLYVHGDQSAALTVSRMAAPWCNNICLIQGEGNFGTRVSPVDGIGAPRYTEVKKTEFAESVMYPDLGIVPMVENYDGSAHMPETFIPLIPVALLNGVRGMAYGWSTEILPRSIDDLQGAVLEVLKTGKVTNDLLPCYKGYDLNIKRVPNEPNKYDITGKMFRQNTNTVLVTELPPDLTLDNFKDHLGNLIEAKKIEDYIDHSTGTIKVEIKLRRTILNGMTDQQLITMLKIRQRITERIVVLNFDQSGVTQYNNAADLIKDFVEWRFKWYATRYKALLDTEIKNSYFWLTVVSCFLGTNNTKPLPSIIKDLKNRSEVKDYIRSVMKSIDIPYNENFSNKISEFATYRWTKDGLIEAQNNLDKSLTLMDEYDMIVNNQEKRKEIFQNEVRKISYGGK